MRILYGVVGEGMGHATRSRVVLEHLAQAGHDIKVVVSGRAHGFLVDRLRNHPNVSIEQIEGLTLSYLGNELDHGASIFNNLRNAPKAVARNVEVYRNVAEAGFRPELVVSDFESWAALYGIRHGLPVISIDNMQIINRCRHERALLKGAGFDFRLTRLAVKAKVPGAFHYLITTFFTPAVRKKYTSLVPAILRPEIQSARREPGEHILVYQTQSTHHDLIQTLKRLPYQFLVYGLRRDAVDGNVRLCAFSETQFVEDLRTARGVLAGGGFSLMSEAVSLGVPMLSVPVVGQFEQELNARYLAELGFGEYTPELSREALQRFLSRLDEYSMRLRERPHYDNSMLFGCLDELIDRVQRGERRVVALDHAVLGKYDQ
ncbi:MAG TPA: glycosyltransferase family protein [Polyangiaceae bacterium]|nr:glycosyltransferase family protein [Polyangiaceae bacterium]